MWRWAGPRSAGVGARSVRLCGAASVGVGASLRAMAIPFSGYENLARTVNVPSRVRMNVPGPSVGYRGGSPARARQ